MGIKKCVRCGETKDLAIHHINGIHGDNREENRTLICNYCHTKAHHPGFHRMSVGDIGYVKLLEKLEVYVEVLKIKTSYGMVRYQIRPVAGYGEQYIQNIMPITKPLRSVKQRKANLKAKVHV